METLETTTPSIVGGPTQAAAITSIQIRAHKQTSRKLLTRSETAQKKARTHVPAGPRGGEAPVWPTGSVTHRANRQLTRPIAVGREPIKIPAPAARLARKPHQTPPVYLSLPALVQSFPQEDLGFARSAFVLLGPSPNPAAPPPSPQGGCWITSAAPPLHPPRT